MRRSRAGRRDERPARLEEPAIWAAPFPQPPSRASAPIGPTPPSLAPSFLPASDSPSPSSAQLSSPFLPRMAQKENAYPWPYGRQTVRTCPPPLPPPAGRVPAWGLEVVRRTTLRVLPALLQGVGPKTLLAEPGLGICNYTQSGAPSLNLISLGGALQG